MRIIPSLFCLGALLALSACGASYPYREKTIQVEESQITHTVHFAKGSDRLGLSERRKISQFTAAIRPESVQQVEIETHGDSGLSHERAHIIKSELIKAGFPTPVFRHDYVKRTVQNVNVNIKIATAIPPRGCPDWGSRASPNFSNQMHSNFACATKNNIARQVANPTDLVHGNNVDAPDPERTQALMTPYRLNTQVDTQADSASGQ